MIELDLKHRAAKFILSLPPKHQRQIKDYLIRLQDNPMPHDVKHLTGYSPYLRGDAGEYRIIYKYELSDALITIVLIGRRNDGAVYREMRRILD